MSDPSELREQERKLTTRLELVTVYRDRDDTPYQELLQKLDALSSIYTIFSLVAVVRDVSQRGVGVAFEGQQIMADNMLRPGERYVLKLTLAIDEVPEDIAPYLHSEDAYQFLLIKVHCRWYRSKPTRSIAGFELAAGNVAAVETFVQKHLGIPEVR